MQTNINDGTTTEDLLATIGNAKRLGESSFEQGCTVLDAVAEFDKRCGMGKLGTWRAVCSRTALVYMPATDSWDDKATHKTVCERLAHAVVAYTIKRKDTGTAIGAAFGCWVVVDRATRVVWVEFGPANVKNPRAAGEFASSAQGWVEADVTMRLGEDWSYTLDDVCEAYHAAKDQLDGELS